MQCYTTAILPLGVLFSASLVLSNTAYVYLSVSFVQMLKVSLAHCPPFFLVGPQLISIL